MSSQGVSVIEGAAPPKQMFPPPQDFKLLTCCGLDGVVTYTVLVHKLPKPTKFNLRAVVLYKYTCTNFLGMGGREWTLVSS